MKLYEENAIAGSLPKDLCYSIPGLERLNLLHDQFNGEIPESLSHCKSLLVIDLSYNYFTGNIPRDIGNLSLLQEFYLSRNNLEGELPKTVFNISSLVRFGINSNEIAGSLPADLCYLLPMLEGIGIGVNRFVDMMTASINVGKTSASEFIPVPSPPTWSPKVNCMNSNGPSTTTEAPLSEAFKHKLELATNSTFSVRAFLETIEGSADSLLRLVDEAVEEGEEGEL
ncbi:hypothetical protein RJ639_006613 [Escallonia herrerae]|uniref:Uncharacterized protein n=1 Tax=Escallonia herrerae TaxID=1293975 RepID=A0AA89AV72_9ASTE|nr:hypothetical protein RJ639_006613 [Escallonia herrerae]